MFIIVFFFTDTATTEIYTYGQTLPRHAALPIGDDLEIVGRRRCDATRLGFAMLLLTMRWPGRALEAGEVPPAPVLGYVARQLGVAPDAFADYARRDQT